MKTYLLLSFLFVVSFVNCKNVPPISYNAYASIDSSSSYTIENYKQLSSKHIFTQQQIKIGHNIQTSVWCTFRLTNNTQLKQTTWICFNNNRIDTLECYMNGEKSLLGDKTNKNSNFLMVPAFKVELHPNETREVVIRLKKELSFLEFKFSLQDEEKLQKESRLSIFLISFFSGLVFLFLLLTITLYVITKQKIYLLFTSYYLLSEIYLLIASGFTKFILFPDFTFFSEAITYTGSLWFIALSLFISEFLNLKKNQFKKFKLLQILIGLNVFMLFVTILLFYSEEYSFLKVTSTIRYIVFLFTILVLILASADQLRINKTIAAYALISFFPHFIWVLSIILQAFGWSVFEIPVNWLISIAFFDISFFGFVLTKQYLVTHKKNNDLQKVLIENQSIAIQSIAEAQIRERKQLANIIHDHFGSKLTHVLHLLELQNHSLAKENIRELTKEMRGVSHQILPKSLESGAFSSAIEHQIDQLNIGLEDSKIELHNYDFPNVIDEQLSVTLFLITLEIINNALNHGEAKQIIMELYGYDDQLVIQFSDNGKGYNTTTEPKGFGITTIENRILNAKGTIEIASEINSGTMIQISIPISKAES